MSTVPFTVRIAEYDYDLPAEKIAAVPLPQRDASKLLLYKEGKIEDAVFSTLPAFLPAHSTLVINNTKVIEARIYFQKSTGALIEIFCLEPFHPADMITAMAAKGKVQWQCLIGGASKWKRGQVLEKRIEVEQQPVLLSAVYREKRDDHFIIEFNWNSPHSFSEILHSAGTIPLPPYIKRTPDREDTNRYQTIFGEQEGSVAAPTAALHFTSSLFAALPDKHITPLPVTLHVGAGTFKPVKTETIQDHQMHGETFSVTSSTLIQLLSADFITAVGTTSLRTLESLHWLGIKLLTEKTEPPFVLSQWEAYGLMNNDISYKESLQALLNFLQASGQTELWCRTSLLIAPGYVFQSAKALVTNFHQPRSTLLLLVAAFIGDDWQKVYEHALANNYRFLSYGDSSLLWRKG